MTLEEIEKIRPGLNKNLDIDECEQNFDVIDIFEDLASSGERFIICIQRKYTTRKYQLFINCDNWELYDDQDFDNPLNHKSILEGNILTLKYWEGEIGQI